MNKIVSIILFVAVMVCVDAAERVVVRPGRLLNVKTGEMLSGQAIVIENEKIIQVGLATQVKGDRTIDLPHATLLPGLIDMHTHLTVDMRSFGYAGLGLSYPRQALMGAKNAKTTIMAGFTTVRNVGAPGYTDIALRDAINDGDVIGPRMVVSGPPLGITGGHSDCNLLPITIHCT